MEANRAAENLQTIRTLMERSALYRRALAPIMFFCGIVGVASGFTGWLLQINSDRSFGLFWTGVAVVALTGSFILVRRQALKDSEPFWSPPTRRVAQALLPPFVIGFVIGAALVIQQHALNQLEAVNIWTWLFGCGICSAGFFMPRGIKLFGWLFILFGCVLFVVSLGVTEIYTETSPHLLMGGIFGGLHLAYGIYLYLTESRNTVA